MVLERSLPMFYFLILTGSAFILFGLYSRKHQMTGPDPVLQAARPKGPEAASDSGVEALRIRMDQIEKLIFQSLMVQEGRKAEGRTGSLEGPGRPSVQLPVESAGAVSADSTGILPAHEEGFTPMAAGILEEVDPVEVPKRKPMPDNIRAIADYEKQGLSVQEIANVTRMKKGEVLLLKNLSKHYSR
jgi:hypothetical protein